MNPFLAVTGMFIGILGGGVILALVIGFWWAWWLHPAWAWFLVPLGVKPITLWHFWALWALLKMKSPEFPEAKPSETKREVSDFVAWGLANALGPILTWAFLRWLEGR